MKTQEEIEQLAFLKYPRLINDPYNPMEDDNAYERQIWIDAYIQCQEDNAEKKYTEEDIRQAIERTYRYVDNDGWSLDYIKEDIINSLSKQTI